MSEPKKLSTWYRRVRLGGWFGCMGNWYWQVESWRLWFPFWLPVGGFHGIQDRDEAVKHAHRLFSKDLL